MRVVKLKEYKSEKYVSLLHLSSVAPAHFPRGNQKLNKVSHAFFQNY